MAEEILDRLGDVDRSRWPAGPWDTEPDRVAWVDSSTGLHCLALRGGLGNWCGYVAVPPGHPAHGVDYDHVDVDVHGGLTYADRCFGEPGRGICHRPAAGEPDDVWWLGFDCAHLGDIVPQVDGLKSSAWSKATYRDLGYVRGEVARLAAQLAGAVDR